MWLCMGRKNHKRHKHPPGDALDIEKASSPTTPQPSRSRPVHDESASADRPSTTSDDIVTPHVDKPVTSHVDKPVTPLPKICRVFHVDSPRDSDESLSLKLDEVSCDSRLNNGSSRTIYDASKSEMYLLGNVEEVYHKPQASENVTNVSNATNPSGGRGDCPQTPGSVISFRSRESRPSCESPPVTSSNSVSSFERNSPANTNNNNSDNSNTNIELEGRDRLSSVKSSSKPVFTFPSNNVEIRNKTLSSKASHIKTDSGDDDMSKIRPATDVQVADNRRNSNINKRKSFSLNNIFASTDLQECVTSPTQIDSGYDKQTDCNASSRSICVEQLKKQNGKTEFTSDHYRNLDSVTQDLLDVANSLSPSTTRTINITSTLEQFKVIRLDILKSTSKLLDCVNVLCKANPTVGQLDLSSVGLLCLQLKTCLHELENFALDLLSTYNSTSKEHVLLCKRIRIQLKQMKDVNGGINRYLESLEDTSDISMQDSPVESASVKLGNIVLLTRGIPLIVRTLATTVEQILNVPNSTLTGTLKPRDPRAREGERGSQHKMEICDDGMNRNNSEYRTKTATTDGARIPPDIVIDSSFKQICQNNEREENKGNKTILPGLVQKVSEVDQVLSYFQEDIKNCSETDIYNKDFAEMEKYCQQASGLNINKSDVRHSSNNQPDVQTYSNMNAGNNEQKETAKYVTDVPSHDVHKTTSVKTDGNILLQDRPIVQSSQIKEKKIRIQENPNLIQTKYSTSSNRQYFTSPSQAGFDEPAHKIASSDHYSSPTRLSSGTNFNDHFLPDIQQQQFQGTSPNLPSPNQTSPLAPSNLKNPTLGHFNKRPDLQPSVTLSLRKDSNEPPELPPKQKNYQKSYVEDVFDSDCSVAQSNNDLRQKDSLFRLTSNDGMVIESPPTMRKQRSMSSGRSGSGVVIQTHQYPNWNQQPINDGAMEVDAWISTSDLTTPDIRVASGVSLSVQTELEELRRQADSHSVSTYDDLNAILNHTSPIDKLFGRDQNHADNEFISRQTSAQTDGRVKKDDVQIKFPNKQFPTGNVPGGNVQTDMQLLLFFSNQISQHWSVIDNAASVFFRSIEGKPSPKLFVMHSQFIILGGRKMTYLGEQLARGLSDSAPGCEMDHDYRGSNNAKELVESYSNRLCEALKMSVLATRDAALEYPSVPHVQLMVDAIKDVTDWALNLKDIVFRLAYLSTGS